MSPIKSDIPVPSSRSPPEPLASTSTSTSKPPQSQPDKTPRFYLPSPSVSSPHTPNLPLSRVHSRASSDSGSSNFNLRSIPNFTSITSSSSNNVGRNTQFDGLFQRRSSKASISILRSALELYQIHPTSSSSASSSRNSSQETIHNYSIISPNPSDNSSTSTNNTKRRRKHQHQQNDSSSSNQNSDSDPDQSSPSISPSEDIGINKMMALVDIHRVLYRGKEDLQAKRIELTLKEEAKLVRNVGERWFESDCVYDQPFVHITNRESLLTHFALLHIFGTIYLPSFTPYSVIIHIKEILSILSSLLFSSPSGQHDEKPFQSHKEGKQKGTIKFPSLIPNPGREENLLGLGLNLNLNESQGYNDLSRTSQIKTIDMIKKKEIGTSDKIYPGWWKLWDITAECKEIGEMECYDGHYLALLEQVIKLSFFPTYRQSPIKSPLSHPSAFFHPKTPNPHIETTPRQIIKDSNQLSGIGIPAFPLPSFAKRLFGILKGLIECWLDWELRINTMIQFNEVGRATHIKDVIDIRDLVECLIPLTKKFRWVSSFIGFITSTIGAIILIFIETEVKVDKKVNSPNKSDVTSIPIPMEKKGRHMNSPSNDRGTSEKLPRGVMSAVGGPVISEKTPFDSERKSSSLPMRIKSPSIASPSRGRKSSAPTLLTSMNMTSTSNTLGLEGVSSSDIVQEGVASTSDTRPNVDQV